MKIIGHRGARGLAPENTVYSVHKALQHSVDQIEIDVRVTQDDQVILHHNAVLLDPGGNRLRIAESTLEQLRVHKADIATLDEVINAVDGKADLMIEIKPKVRIDPIVKILANYKTIRVSIASKSQSVLRAFHATSPKTPLVVIEAWSGVRASRRARELDTKYVSMNQLWLWWGFINRAKKGDWQLYAYTLNNPKKARRWAKHGLAGVITDYPDQFEH